MLFTGMDKSETPELPAWSIAVLGIATRVERDINREIQAFFVCLRNLAQQSKPDGARESLAKLWLTVQGARGETGYSDRASTLNKLAYAIETVLAREDIR